MNQSTIIKKNTHCVKCGKLIPAGTECIVTKRIFGKRECICLNCESDSDKVSEVRKIADKIPFGK